MQCPTKEEFADCLLGKVATARASVLLDHAEVCDACGRVVEDLDQATDEFVEVLGQGDSSPVSDSCERMIDRAEIYGGPETFPQEAGSQTTKQHLLQGTKVRDYEIVHPIGEGGMGAVFLARHSRLNRDVALKVLSLRRSGDREAQRRFEQEMAIVGKLQHPGIVRALDAGEHEGVQYLVMELINGADLRQIVDVLGPVPLSDACEIARLAATALHYAHEQNLIHRDVKPSNLMLHQNGAVKVMDLGLARFTDQHRSLTSTQQAMGSLDFMAPEQLRAAEVDRRADIYGLGCTLHFLLMGEPPEKRRTASLMVARTPKLEALKSLLPPPLTKLMQQMLAADPAKRVGSLAEVADQLAPFCNRSDLEQLSKKATKLVRDAGGDSGDSITSDVNRRDENSKRLNWPKWAGIIAASVATIALAAWLTSSNGPFGSRAKKRQGQPVELSKIKYDSSNIDETDEIPLFQIHDQAITQISYNESTSQLICGSEDTSISVRDLPNQKRITRAMLFDSPVRKIRVVPNRNLCVCLDDAGNVACLQLPSASTKWMRTWNATNQNQLQLDPTRPTELRVGEYLELRNDDGLIELVSFEDGTTVPVEAADHEAEDFVEFPLLGPLRTETTDELRLYGKPVGSGLYMRARQVCLVKDRRVLFVDQTKLQNQDDYEYFMYAEHEAPITSMLGFPEESMVATGDASGVVRLWHVPEHRPSYMLLSCVAKLKSIGVTVLLNQGHWSQASFPSSPDEVKRPNLLGEMRLETEIERNGMRHVLEYRITPKPAAK